MEVTDPDPFGMLLRRHRTEAGLTQEELAEHAGVSARVVSDLERGVTHTPQRRTVHQLADALRLSEEDRAQFQECGRRRPRSMPCLANTRTETLAALPIAGFLGALPIDALVERQQELGRIQDAADAAAGGSGALVLLTGEPGVGKTRLAQEAMLALRERGFVVASGRCYEPQQTVPYYPFLDVLSTLYDTLPANLAAQTSERWPYLAYLLPDLMAQPTESATGWQDVQRLFRAVGGFLIAVAEKRPVALLLDDLHWADHATLDLLQHLARSTRASPVLLLGTCRQDEVGPQHPLTRTLLALNREGLVEQVPIQPLDERGTTALIAAVLGDETPSPEFCALVYRHTEGNPFFTREVLRALVERGELYQENGQWQRANVDDIEVPHSVRAVVAERASRLPERAQEVVYEASVLGHTFGFDHLLALNHRSEQEIEAALEEASAAGMVREMGGDEYSFNHVLTQHALYAELPARKKRRFHLTAGAALEQRLEGSKEASFSDLVRHFVRGGRPDRALPYAMRAGDAAKRVFAHGDAERSFQTALALARELGHSEYAAGALEKLGDTLKYVGRYDAALEALDEAVEIYRSVGDPNGEGRAEASIGMAHFARRTSLAGIARLGPRTHALMDRVSVDVRCELYEAESQLYFGTNQYLELLESAEWWVEAARKAGGEKVLALARGAHGVALFILGRMNEAIAAHEEGLELAERAGDRYALRLNLNNLAEAYQMDGALEKAKVLRERDLEVTEEMGYRDEVAVSLCGFAQTLILLGEWKRARLLLIRAADIPSTASWYAGAPSLTLADLCLLQGDRDGARHHVAEGLKFAERNQVLHGIRWGQLTLAELNLALGKPKDAVDSLVPFLDRDGLEEAQVTWMLPALAEAHVLLAENPDGLELAEATVHEALRRATAHRGRIQLVKALRVRGMLHIRQGRLERAQDAFSEAVSIARSISLPYEEARDLYEWGRMHAGKGDFSLARERLKEALRIFQRLGAQFHIEQTQQALAV